MRFVLLALCLMVPLISSAVEPMFLPETSIPTFISTPIASTYTVGQVVERSDGSYIVTETWIENDRYMYRLKPVPQIQPAPQVQPVSIVQSPSFQLKQTQWDNIRWTYPGTITNHLQDHNHQVPASVLASLSPSEQVTLHNQLHQSGTVRFSNLYGDSNRYITSTTNCPNGQCPTSVTSTRLSSGYSSPPTISYPVRQYQNCPTGNCPLR